MCYGRKKNCNRPEVKLAKQEERERKAREKEIRQKTLSQLRWQKNEQ